MVASDRATGAEYPGEIPSGDGSLTFVNIHLMWHVICYRNVVFLLNISKRKG